MKLINSITASLSILILLAALSCEKAKEPSDIWKVQEEQLLVEIIKGREDLSITLEAAQKVYVYNLLQTYGPYTFFAPNNDAWNAYFQAKGITGLADMDDSMLESIFEYHILAVEKETLNLQNGLMEEADSTVNGDRLYINLTGGLDNILINNQAKIIEGNVEAWNGFMHVVDHVLDPPLQTIAEYLEVTPDYSRFYSFLKENGVVDTLNLIRMNNFPYTRNEYSVLAIENAHMDRVGQVVDSLKIVDLKYEAEVAKDPDYANKAFPNQVAEYAASFVLSGTEYTANMFSSFMSTIAEVPYGDNVAKIKLKVNNGNFEINDQVEIVKEKADKIMKNGVIHTCSGGFAPLAQSPRNLVFSAHPKEKWNTSQGASVKDERSDGYIADDGTYGIVTLQPTAIGAKFWIEIPDVPAGDYFLRVIGKKGGSQVKVTVNGSQLFFEGANQDGIYDFAYILGNRGRVDNLPSRPASKTWLQLYDIPTANFKVKATDKFVKVLFEATYLNNNGANMSISAIILEPAVL